MNAMQRQVEEFHRAFSVAVGTTPSLPDRSIRKLREALIEEELAEFRIANREPADITEAADAIADMLYVIFGAASAYGIDIEPVFNEVHRSNMSKLWTPAEMMAHKGQPLTFIGAGDRFVAKRADGKVIKAPGYSPADIAKVLAEQGLKIEPKLQQGALFDGAQAPAKPGHAN
jgi:NTP pyrophosphatase (non-canonical NTP hydrolase)